MVELKQQIEQVKEQIIKKRDEISEKQKEINLYTVERDDDEYEDYLNDSFGDVDICGMNFLAGSALRELDPTAFRIGLIDWLNSLDPSDEDEYKELECDLEDLEAELEDLESEESELEAELEHLESELESD